MAFIDGVKAQYVDYFDLLLPLLGSGAVLAVDNVLMSGTVADNRTDGHWTEEQIAFARGFNERLLSSDQLTGTLTPVGDGVLHRGEAMSPQARRAAGAAAPADDRTRCTPCRGTGQVVSGLGGTPHEVTCPWCGGSGEFGPGRDAQDSAPST